MSSENSDDHALSLQTVRIGNTKFYLDSDCQITNQNREILGHETSITTRGEILLQLVEILQYIEADLH